jgi:predicted kinase
MRVLRKTAWIMLGVAGSGKSTWIKENLGNGILVISKDGIREELGIIRGEKKAIGNKEQEKKVQEIHDQRIRDAIRDGKSFVLDNTNLGKDLKDKVKELKEAGYKVIGVRINTPIDVCIKRRPEIPEKHLRNMDRKLKEIDTTIFDKLVEP